MSAASVCHTTGKSVLPDRKTAQRAAKNASHRYSQAMAAYRCKDCGAWHFGHTMRRAKPLRLIHHFHDARLT